MIVGGGPAGLTAAYQLSKQKIPATLLEKDDILGGLAKTLRYRGFCFDIGGHRFFTKAESVNALWHEILPDHFLKRPRLSRIHYRGKFFHYPLRAGNALAGLGLWNSISIGLSYLWARLFPQQPEESFETWVRNRFGRRLYQTFFKTYTEKVWGIPCTEISAEWAAQRIKGLSLVTAIKNALGIGTTGSKKDVVKTLIGEFEYPEQGPGMMWEAAANKIQEWGGSIHLKQSVNQIGWSGDRIDYVECESLQRYEGTHFISSMPLRELIAAMDPQPPEHVVAAAHKLRYRDFIIVALIVEKADIFPDTWIYVHEPEVKVGRIQNFKNWSPAMVPDLSRTCLGFEYFCFEGDGLWTMSDEALIVLARREAAQLGLVEEKLITDGYVLRVHKAYPVYDGTSAEATNVLREFIDGFSNLQVVGRNGMHKYNNQDHSMLTAMMAVENITGEKHDLWAVNADMEYHEESRASEEMQAVSGTQPRVPIRRNEKD